MTVECHLVVIRLMFVKALWISVLAHAVTEAVLVYSVLQRESTARSCTYMQC
jgi:hypothetical protein